jgi:lauroyl/myristoyl acyltransferase
MLARLGQAQVIPVVSSWQPGGWIEVRLFAPLSSGSESDVFLGMGHFFEDYIRRNPGQLEEKSLMKLLCAPACEG